MSGRDGGGTPIELYRKETALKFTYYTGHGKFYKIHKFSDFLDVDVSNLIIRTFYIFLICD